jgi:hypothetical protein
VWGFTQRNKESKGRKEIHKEGDKENKQQMDEAQD